MDRFLGNINNILTSGRINNWAMDVLRGKPTQYTVNAGQIANEASPLDVIYPRGGNMNFRTYYNKVGTSGFPGRTVLDLLPGKEYIKQAGIMVDKNWSPVIKKGQELLNKTGPMGKAAPMVAKVGTGITLATAPVIALSNNTMARQMEKENRINPYLHTSEAITNRRARNANMARWAGLGGALGFIGGPGTMAQSAAGLIGASQLGEGIADKFSKRKSVVNGVGTYSPLYLTDEQLQRVLMTQAERDANPRGGVQANEIENNNLTPVPDNSLPGLEEIDASYFSDPSDFPYKTSWMGNTPNNSGYNNPIPYDNYNIPGGDGISDLRGYIDTPQEVFSDENGNPILTGAVDNDTPGLDFNNLRNYMTPGEIAYQDYLNNSPLSDPQKIVDLILQADRDRFRYEVMANMMAPKNVQELPSGAFVLQSNYRTPRAPMSNAEAILKAQSTAGDILKLQSELEGAALQRQGAEQVARQLNLPPALLTNPDLAKQALVNYGNLQRVGLQENNRYSIAQMNNSTKREIARDINILSMNKLYSDRQIAQARLNMQEKIAKITGDARYASALVNLATNAMEPQQQAQAQFILNQILKDAGYDTSYTTSSDVETNDNFGYGQRIPGDTL